MKRPVAWSLVRRLTGGVVLIALLSFAAQALVLNQWVRPVAREISGIAAEQAVMARSALAAVPAADRSRLADRLSTGSLRVGREAPPGPPVQGRPLPPEMAAADRWLASQQISVHVHEQADKGFVVGFRTTIDGEPWWIQRRADGPGEALLGTLVVWLALLASVTLVALLASVRLIARPLGRVADAIGAQRGDLRPIAVDSSASTELQQVVHAFNALVDAVVQATQARQQLLAGVSHDLRTPLARLRLRVETQCPPELADELIADLHALERIVDQFLAYVHGETGVPPGELRPLDAVVREVADRYADEGQPVGRVVAACARAVPDVALQRLLGNLVDNALAYGRGPVTVELRVTGDGCPALTVYDHGRGMTADEFARAQRPFVRLEPACGAIGHCGLGLAIVGQLARQIGATLELRPAVDGRFGVGVVLPVGRGAA